jgi:hypothetical protein
MKGYLSRSAFGRWLPNRSCDGDSVVDCDLSGMRLDSTRFFNTDMTSIRLPGWPCVTVLDPLRQAQRIRSIDWPSPSFADVYTSLPQGISAVSDFVPSLVRDLGGSESEWRQCFEQLEQAHF